MAEAAFWPARRPIVAWLITATCLLVSCASTDLPDHKTAAGETRAIRESTPSTGVDAYRRAALFLSGRTNRLVQNASVSPFWIANTNTFWYRRQIDNGDAEFALVDASSGETNPAFDHALLARLLEKASGEATDQSDLPFDHFAYGRSTEFMSFRAFGRAWHCDLGRESCVEQAPTAEPHELLSPDGRSAVFVRDHNLYIRELQTGRVRILTTDGQPYLAYGKSPDMNSLSVTLRRRNIDLPPMALWSPDSSKILVGKLDERDVHELHLLQSVPNNRELRPRLHSFRYAMPGDDHVPTLTLYVIDVESGSKTVVKHHSIASPFTTVFEKEAIWWSSDGQYAYFIDVERGESAASLVIVTVETGNARVVLREESSTYIQTNPTFGLRPNVRILGSGAELLWYSERDGWGHLYLYDTASGTLKNQVTSGPWVVRDIVHVDEGQRLVYFVANGRQDGEPYNRYFYRVNLDGTGLELLTPEDADHDIKLPRGKFIGALLAAFGVSGSSATSGLSPTASFFVDTYSRPDHAPVSVLRTTDGELVTVFERANTDYLETVSDRPLPESFRVKAADDSTDIFGILYKPAQFDPKKSYPILDHIYGGPQMLGAARTFSGSLASDASGLAELGFVVVELDGRGTPYRSKKFHDLSTGPGYVDRTLADHVAAIQQLADQYEWIDSDRVGIFGHSAGGYSTVRAMLLYPEVFTVGVASSGNYDQRAYLSDWGERYLGMPEVFADGSSSYDAQSNGRLAGNLEGRLMLMTGDMDENTHPAMTLQLVDALISANRDFDLLVIPNGDHFSKRHPYFVRKRWDYFVEHLLGARPPDRFEISSTE